MRHFAIGDIHGCATALAGLLELVSPGSEDVVVTLGDYVDRGPDSRGVVDLLLDLGSSCRHIPLRGNHEIMMLDARDNASWLDPWLSYGGEATLQSYGGEFADVPAAHFDFLENQLLPYYECQTHFFVHANAAPTIALADQPDAVRYWQKYKDPQPHCSGKIMVCGHTVQTSGMPSSNGHSICIDTCAYRDGWLTCLDVESGKIWQANEFGETRSSNI